MIEIKNLGKIYKDVYAVKDLSLTVKEGDAFGFIGPNGAGKTTTIRMLATLLEPTDGDALICGRSILNDPREVRKVIGYMPDFFGVYDGMMVWEYLDFFARAFRINGPARGKLIDGVLELTDLGAKKDVAIETLSTGMKQRLCLAKTLLHDPRVLILDEPAAGLDPRARIEFKELMRELIRLGKTIFISSHILPELADFCNTIGILEAGRLLACGKVEDIVHAISEKRVFFIRTIGELSALEALKDETGIKDVKIMNHNLVRIEYAGSAEDAARLLETLVERRIRLLEFYEEKTNLEDVFMKITRGHVT